MSSMKAISYKCSVKALFPNADELITQSPIGYINESGGGGIKTEFWARATDPLIKLGLTKPGCEMFLVKFLDGSPVAVRYDSQNVVLYQTKITLSLPRESLERLKNINLDELSKRIGIKITSMKIVEGGPND